MKKYLSAQDIRKAVKWLEKCGHRLTGGKGKNVFIKIRRNPYTDFIIYNPKTKTKEKE